jgi:UDP-N-acetylglucosamine transferase subunit ALG13
MAAAFRDLSKGGFRGEHLLIFVCLGTQEFQFDRLLQKVDELLSEKIIQEEVIAQVGYSCYKPSEFACTKFMKCDEFDEMLEKSSYVITHGGTGTIIKALRKGKKVIAVPRLKKHGEHVDDHQKEIIGAFREKNLILGLTEVDQLEDAVKQVGQFTPDPFVSGNSRIISIIEDFIRNNG